MSGESFDASSLNGKSEKKVYLLRKNSLSKFTGDVSGSADGNLDGESRKSAKAGSDCEGFL
jgi:hypothetical protein